MSLNSASDDLHLSIGAASLGAGMGPDWTSPSATIARFGRPLHALHTRSANAFWPAFREFRAVGRHRLNASQASERNGLLGNFSPAVQTADTSASECRRV